ncbi:hypothetical protein EMPS_05937 [Entomortierella parvispora]|uniref:WW domain-containing protein n=1 Tax=Entomortierella parvispora TaxID=205924 RepID=A0A9P3HBD1_9FUNG|nr:hypothetical protein EMPS_05937 [Entomortierella parvispora]
MGCSNSKGVENGSTYHRPQTAYNQSQALPPSTLPQGWISQYDPSKQRLFYVYPQTNNVTWAHPLGPAADAQENARFHQIQEIQRQQFGNNQGFYDNYNRGGGLGSGASMAMGMMAGGALGLMAGSMMGGGMMHGGMGYGGGDTIPATYDGGGGFGGGDFGGGDFGGGDFGGGF